MSEPVRINVTLPQPLNVKVNVGQLYRALTDATIGGDGSTLNPLSIQPSINYLLSLIRQLAPELTIDTVTASWDEELVVVVTTSGGLEPITTIWSLDGTILTVTTTDAVGQEDENIIDLANEYPIIINSVDVEWDNGLIVTVNATGGFGEYIVTFTQDGAILNITVTDQIGIEATTTADLDTISPIAISSLTSETTGENEAVITCVASGGYGNLLYSLYFGDTFIESNETGIFTVTEEGTYSVVVSDEGGATPDSDTIEIAFGLPFQDDLIFKAISRSGMELLDASNTKQADILTPLFLQGASSSGRIDGNKARVQERLFDGNNYTLFFEFKQLVAANEASTNQPIAIFGSDATARRGLRLYNNLNKIRMTTSDGTATINTDIVSSLNANFNTGAIFSALIQINHDTKRVNAGFYDANNNVIGSVSDVDISAFVFNNNENFAPFRFNSKIFGIFNFKKYQGLVSIANATNEAYRTGLQIHLPSIWDCVDISGNGCDFLQILITSTDRIYNKANDLPLVNGSDLYIFPTTGAYVTVCRDADGFQYVPNRSAGEPLVGTRIMWESAPNQMLNVRDCKLRFVNAFFDRSNATIWNANARGAGYDAANPKDFHFDELNQRTLQSWLNDGYRGKLALHFDSNSVEEWDKNNLIGIYLYNTDKKGNDHKRVLSFTGDYACAVIENGNPELDANGYVRLGFLQATKPMILMVFDDGYVDLLTTWKAHIDALGLKPLIGIHAGQMGEMSDQAQYYLSWAELKQLTDEGWGVADHNYTDIDYSSLGNLGVIDSQMQASKAAALANGYTLKHYVGNRHSSSNPSVRWFSKKNGYLTHFTWNVYGEGDAEGANPKNINLRRIRRMAMDIDSPANTNVNVTPNAIPIANCKAQVDIAKDNRILVPFMHAYTDIKKDALIEVVNYAVAEGLTPVDIDEMMNNLKYK